MDFIDKRCIVRTESAGVFFGTVKKIDDNVVELENSRRIWYWSGAASLSELAVDGTSDPNNCKFPCVVKHQLCRGWNEIIPTTKKAEKSIDEVKTWTA